jgi:hypothetical protein
MAGGLFFWSAPPGPPGMLPTWLRRGWAKVLARIGPVSLSLCGAGPGHPKDSGKSIGVSLSHSPMLATPPRRARSVLCLVLASC